MVEQRVHAYASASIERSCRRLSCVHPGICENLVTDHGPLLSLMRAVRSEKGIKRVFIAPGVRYAAWAFEGGYTATPSKHAYVSITGGLRHLNGFPVNNTGEFQPIVRMNIGLGF